MQTTLSHLIQFRQHEWKKKMQKKNSLWSMRYVIIYYVIIIKIFLETLVVLFVSISAFKVLFIKCLKVLREEPRQIVVSLLQKHWILRAHSDPHIKIRVNSLISSWDLTTTRLLWHRAKGAYTASDEWGQWWRMFQSQRASYCRAYLQISKKYLHVDSQMLTRHLKQTPFLKL